MNIRKLATLLLALSTFYFAAGNCFASDNDDLTKKKLAEFFHVSADRVSLECPQNSYELTGEGEDSILGICLNKADRKKRCEIAISGLSKAPDENAISYDINFGDPEPRKEFQILMQIHSFPDEGEAWRCPVAALEVQNGNFHMFNRWDPSLISRTSGNNCTEPGSSISSRSILKDVNVRAGEWQNVELRTKLSPVDGLFSLKIDDSASPILNGPNTFNDKKQPFVKFGIYKPTSWEDGHEKSCVKFRHVKIVTGSN